MTTATKIRNWRVLDTAVKDQPTLTGKFRLSSNSLDYKLEDDDDFNFTDYFSQHEVEVSKGYVRLWDLIRACEELHDQTGYWGCWIEALELRPDTNTIEVHFGS